MTVPVVDVAISTRAKTESFACVFPTVILKYGIPLEEQLTGSSTKYVVKWNYDLEGGEITVPANCILDFDGGQLQNGTIHWDDTKVLNQYKYEILHNMEETGRKILL